MATVICILIKQDTNYELINLMTFKKLICRHYIGYSTNRFTKNCAFLDASNNSVAALPAVLQYTVSLEPEHEDDDLEHDDYETVDQQRYYYITSFYQAARAGNVELIREKIKTEYRSNRTKLKKVLNTLDDTRMSPLHYAAKYGKVEAARLLVEYGADPVMKGDDGCLPMHFAVKYRPNVYAEEDSTSPESPRSHNPARRRQSLFQKNCSFIETLNFLIEKGIEQSGVDIISADDAYGGAPLHYAVYRNNVAAARILLEQKAQVDDQDHQGQTALHLAARIGSREIFKLFIEYGANVSLTMNDGTTVLDIAVSEGHENFARLVLESIDSGNIKYLRSTGQEGIRKALQHTDNQKLSILHYAVESSDGALMTFLLRSAQLAGCKNLVNAHRLNGDTALHLAAEKGALDVVKSLCMFRAKTDSYNENHETPLYLAAKNNHSDTITFLLEQEEGLEAKTIDKRDADGWTPLLIAAAFSQKEAADVLLENNADIKARNKNDKNLVFIAATEGHDSFLEHIFDYCEANNLNQTKLVNRCDASQNTALHIAAQNGHIS